MKPCPKCYGTGVTNVYGVVDGKRGHHCITCHGLGMVDSNTGPTPVRQRKKGSGNWGVTLVLLVGGYIAYQWFTGNSASIEQTATSFVETVVDIIMTWVQPLIGLLVVTLFWLNSDKTLRGWLNLVLVWALFFVPLAAIFTVYLLDLSTAQNESARSIIKFIARFASMVVALVLVVILNERFGSRAKPWHFFHFGPAAHRVKTLEDVQPLLRHRDGRKLAAEEWNDENVRSGIYAFVYYCLRGYSPYSKTERVALRSVAIMKRCARTCGVTHGWEPPYPQNSGYDRGALLAAALHSAYGRPGWRRPFSEEYWSKSEALLKDTKESLGDKHSWADIRIALLEEFWFQFLGTSRHATSDETSTRRANTKAT